LNKIKNNETPIKAISNKGFGGNSSILPDSNFGVGGRVYNSKSASLLAPNRQCVVADN